MAREVTIEAMAVCKCCRGAGVLWVIGGPVVCPHCAGTGEDVAIASPLHVDAEKMH